jgi:hypothetical protein
MAGMYLGYVKQFDAYKIGICRDRDSILERIKSLINNHHWPDIQLVTTLDVPAKFYQKMKQNDKDLKLKFKNKKGTVYIDKPKLQCIFEDRTKVYNAPTKKANGGTEIFNLDKDDVNYIKNFYSDFEKEFIK